MAITNYASLIPAVFLINVYHVDEMYATIINKKHVAYFYFSIPILRLPHVNQCGHTSLWHVICSLLQQRSQVIRQQISIQNSKKLSMQCEASPKLFGAIFMMYRFNSNSAGIMYKTFYGT